MKIFRTVAFLLLLSASATLAVHGHSASNDAESVWAGEEAYWKYVKTGDDQAYRALWSEDFVGWPILRAHPIHKSDISTSGLSNSNRGAVTKYELQRENVEMHGAIGVTFYRAIVLRRKADGSEGTTTERLSHTWMQQSGKWVIVAGMSAHEPEAAASNGPK